MINKKYELEGLIMYYDMDPYMGKYDFLYTFGSHYINMERYQHPV